MTFNENLIDWLSTFWKILISPTPRTFMAESEKADNKFFGAVGWLVFFSVYLFIFVSIQLKQVLFLGLINLILVLPICVIVFTSAMHFIHQRIYKLKQYVYDKLIYITVAILLPIQILIIPISSVALVL